MKQPVFGLRINPVYYTGYIDGAVVKEHLRVKAWRQPLHTCILLYGLYDGTAVIQFLAAVTCLYRRNKMVIIFIRCGFGNGLYFVRLDFVIKPHVRRAVQ